MSSSRDRRVFSESGSGLVRPLRRMAMPGLLALTAVGASAVDAAGRAHYETRYAGWSPSFAASTCGGSDTVTRRIHARGKSFRVVDPSVGDRVTDGTWYPPT